MEPNLNSGVQIINGPFGPIGKIENNQFVSFQPDLYDLWEWNQNNEKIFNYCSQFERGAIVGTLNRCFSIHSRIELNFDDADQYCASTGGSLASFRTLGEYLGVNKLLRNIPHKNYWIGGRKYGIHGGFNWVDGSPWSLENWDGELNPDNLEVEDCIEMIIHNG